MCAEDWLMTVATTLSQRGQRKLGRWVELTLLGLLLAVVIGLGMRGVRLGWGHDLNSRAIFRRVYRLSSTDLIYVDGAMEIHFMSTLLLTCTRVAEPL